MNTPRVRGREVERVVAARVIDRKIGERILREVVDGVARVRVGEIDGVAGAGRRIRAVFRLDRQDVVDQRRLRVVEQDRA